MTLEERKEAIEYLKKYKELDKQLFQIAPFTSVSHDALVKSLRHWDTAIQALEQESKWIPVGEKLPEERKAVLVYAPEYKNIYCAYLSGDTWFIFGGYGSYAVANVVAWMPLPEPYKAESEG